MTFFPSFLLSIWLFGVSDLLLTLSQTIHFLHLRPAPPAPPLPWCRHARTIPSSANPVSLGIGEVSSKTRRPPRRPRRDPRPPRRGSSGRKAVAEPTGRTDDGGREPRPNGALNRRIVNNDAFMVPSRSSPTPPPISPGDIIHADVHIYNPPTLL